MKYMTPNAVNTAGPSSANASSALFCDQINTVTNLFENWNDCERTVVMYTLLKRLRYPSLKFLQYSIDSNLTQSLASTSQSNLSAIFIDISANNPSYLLNMFNIYKALHKIGDSDAMSSSSSDKDSMPCFGSDFQLTQTDERIAQSLPVYQNKEEILHKVLIMLPMLKPGNEEAKLIYLAFIPFAVKDTLRQIIPTDLVQQIFSYMLIHPAISSDDKKSLNVWIRHLEGHIQSAVYTTMGQQQPTGNNPNININNTDTRLILSSSAASSTVCSASAAASTAPVSSSVGSVASLRNTDWQTIAPPTKAQKEQHKTMPLHDWSSVVAGQSIGVAAANINIADKLCDNLNGITLNELASSQNSLGLTIGGAAGGAHDGASLFGPSLVNGVVAAAGISAAPPIFGNSTTNPIINIISNNNNNCMSNLNVDDHDTSFSKNGTEILDFEPSSSNLNDCNSCIISDAAQPQQLQHPQPDEQPHQEQFGYASFLLMNNFDQADGARWSLDGKLTSLKTRRSNSLTTQAISSSASSSSNSSVNTVNENCCNSNENLSQFANKQRSYSLSIEHSRSALTNGGSETRLDDFKPNYIKFQTRNLGMSSIGLWLKSLRLHKYIELFKNMTYEEMLQITEEFLKSLGVTKGASHKLALCIEKLKERYNHLTKMEQELMVGQLKLHDAVEDLANIVLTPMKPIESVQDGEENVALKFLKVIDLVCSLFQKDNYAAQDDESSGVLLWILERSTHNEAFGNHVNHFKDMKFKLSKLKMITPKILHAKNMGSNSNLNKSRWNGKPRKSDSKNGSNDRINHRKNSNDLLNFSLSSMQQQHHNNPQQQQQHQTNDYDKFNHANHQQYKTPSYPNFANTQQQQATQQMKSQQQHHLQQQQPLQQQLMKHVLPPQQFPALPQHPPPPPQQQQQQQQVALQHRRSLNNIVVVNNAPQQPQKMVFKPGQAVLSSTGGMPPTTSYAAESAAITNQQRRASFTNSVSNNVAASYPPNQTAVAKTTNSENATQSKQPQQQHQQQQPKKTMAAVVMVSSDEIAAAVAAQQQQLQQPQILINNNSSHILSSNVLCQQQQQQHLIQQQQQQLQLLAAAAAAVGSSCSLKSSLDSSSICSNNNNCSNTSNCSDCSNLSAAVISAAVAAVTTTETAVAATAAAGTQPCNQLQTPIIANLSLPPNDVYHASQADVAVASTAAMNDIKSLEQLETLCLQMTEQAIN